MNLKDLKVNKER